MGILSCRLLYLIGQLRSGGSERQLYYLLKSMERNRYQPEVVVWTLREADMYVSKIRALGVPLHSFPNGSSRASKLGAFRRLVMQINPDVVHSYSFYTNFAAFWATRAMKTITIGELHHNTGEWFRKTAKAVRFMSANAAKAIAKIVPQTRHLKYRILHAESSARTFAE